MQLIIIVTAFTEVIGIATIGPFMAIASNPQVLDEGAFKAVYEYSGIPSKDTFLIIMGICVVSILLLSAIVATFSLRYIYHFAQKLVLKYPQIFLITTFQQIGYFTPKIIVVS